MPLTNHYVAPLTSSDDCGTVEVPPLFELTFANAIKALSILVSVAVVFTALVYQFGFNNDSGTLIAALIDGFDVVLGAAAVAALVAVGIYQGWAERKHAIHKARGVELANDEQWSAAVNEFDVALACQPHDMICNFGRGMALAMLKEHTAALESLDRAVEAGLYCDHTLTLRSTLLVELGLYERAHDDLTELLTRQPDNFNARVSRSFVTLKLGRFQDSLEDCNLAVEANVDDAETAAVAFNNRGLAFLELGRLQEATLDLERALERNPAFDRPRIHLERVKSELASSQSESAFGRNVGG